MHALLLGNLCIVVVFREKAFQARQGMKKPDRETATGIMNDTVILINQQS